MKLFYKYRITEFEIQAEIFMHLKNLWYQVRWEIFDKTIKEMSDNKKWFRQSRFDILVFKNNIAAIIIEVKRTWRSIWKKTRQLEKYEMYNLPILYFNDLNKKDDLVKNINKILSRK
jgi:hypothetical protein